MAESETKSVCKEIKFTCDDLLLKGTLHLPLNNVPEPPIIIGVHGLFSDSSSPKQIALAEACNANGIAYFRFDHRGCGQSEGDFKAVTSFEGRCRDLLEAVKVIHQRQDVGDRFGCFGSSLGGSICLATAKQIKFIAIVTFATPLHSDPIFRQFEKEDDEAGEVKRKDVDIAKLQFNISDKISGLRNALVFHGDSDKLISPSEAHKIYNQCLMPKRLIMQRDGDHRMSLKANQDKFVRESVAWYKAVLKDSIHPNLTA